MGLSRTSAGMAARVAPTSPLRGTAGIARKNDKLQPLPIRQIPDPDRNKAIVGIGQPSGIALGENDPGQPGAFGPGNGMQGQRPPFGPGNGMQGQRPPFGPGNGMQGQPGAFGPGNGMQGQRPFGPGNGVQGQPGAFGPRDGMPPGPRPGPMLGLLDFFSRLIAQLFARIEKLENPNGGNDSAAPAAPADESAPPASDSQPEAAVA